MKKLLALGSALVLAVSAMPAVLAEDTDAFTSASVSSYYGDFALTGDELMNAINSFSGTYLVCTTNPDGTTKVVTERILQDVCKADPSLNVALLRYFNPLGAHKSGLIGEDPNGIPNNLMPYIAKVAVGKLEKVHVFGNDYPTPDGTGVRDYIHVVDLARGHVCAIKKLETNCGLFICNLGTGKGYSVLDVIHAFSKACGKEIPYVIDPRRPGDIAECYADPTKAKNELGWVAEYGIEEMCADSWNWQKNNPDGYHTVK